MKIKLQLIKDDLENIIGGFTFYVDNEGYPVLFLNKEEIQLIKSCENTLTSSIASIAPSGEPSAQASIYLTKSFLETSVFENTYKGEFKYAK